MIATSKGKPHMYTCTHTCLDSVHIPLLSTQNPIHMHLHLSIHPQPFFSTHLFWSNPIKFLPFLFPGSSSFLPGHQGLNRGRSCCGVARQGWVHPPPPGSRLHPYSSSGSAAFSGGQSGERRQSRAIFTPTGSATAAQNPQKQPYASKDSVCGGWRVSRQCLTLSHRHVNTNSSTLIIAFKSFFVHFLITFWSLSRHSPKTL